MYSASSGTRNAVTFHLELLKHMDKCDRQQYILLRREMVPAIQNLLELSVPAHNSVLHI
jgi:hypothetical protein